MFSLFLKLLGFFVVLYSYADREPVKAEAVEQSLMQQFNVSISAEFTPVKSGRHVLTPTAVQNLGNAYQAISTELKTDVDFLSTEIRAKDNTMRMTLPADILLAFNGNSAKSPSFAHELVYALKKHRTGDFVYNVQMIVRGEQADELMRAGGEFIQYMVAQDYAPRYLEIGFKDDSDPPEVDIVITAVNP